MEKATSEAVRHAETFGSSLTVVRIPHSKSATVTDRLFGTYKNLLVISGDGEINFFGDGQLCQDLKSKYQNSWAGGTGLGKAGETRHSFWGGYANQEDVLKEVTERLGVIGSQDKGF